MDLKPQVERGHYYKHSYISPQRFASYGYQVDEILNCDPRKVLEIGIGNGFVSHVLRRVGLEVTTLDIDANLKPDIAASVINMPLASNTFDVVGCFEILEHIPYQFVPKALSEIARITRKYAVISLPDVRHFIRLDILLPRLGSKSLSFSIPRLTKRSLLMTDEHYWEIGRKNYSLTRIKKEMELSGFNLLKTFQSRELFWHRFFKLEKT